MKRSIPLDHHGYPISKLETDAQIVADSVNPAAWDGFQGNLQYKVVPQWAKSRSWCGYNSNFTTWFMVDISIRQLWFINQQTSLGGTILYRQLGEECRYENRKFPKKPIEIFPIKIVMSGVPFPLTLRPGHLALDDSRLGATSKNIWKSMTKEWLEYAAISTRILGFFGVELQHFEDGRMYFWDHSDSKNNSIW